MGGPGGIGGLPGRAAAATSRRVREHPEAWVYALSAVCWAALIADPAVPAPAHWLLMVGAMMLPMAATTVRHVAFRSFRKRRVRAIAGFLLGYAAVWLAVGPLYLAAGLVIDLAGGGANLVPLAAALALAAAWQATKAKRRALRRCHKTVPLAPSGWRADRACLAFGLAHGRSCLASCWAMMLVPAAAGHHPLPMLLVSLLALCERRTLAAEPLRGPGDLWSRFVALAPSLVPSSVRQRRKRLAGSAPWR